MIPGVVQLRNAGSYNSFRNSRSEVWAEFFRNVHEQQLPLNFIVIGIRDQDADPYREIPNVTIAKDHNTSLEQDLALLRFAPLSFGMCSGPSTTVLTYSQNPYTIIYPPIDHVLPESLIRNFDGGFRLVFANSNQRYMRGPESVSLLMSELILHLETVNLLDWVEDCNQRCGYNQNGLQICAKASAVYGGHGNPVQGINTGEK